MAEKKYYWLKLKRDFFKRHDITILERMSNGKDYELFYLKLMLESIDHDGELRFNDTIPYNDEMLSAITNTNIDIVRTAVKVLTSLDMLELWDDGTIFVKEVQKMIGSETSGAERVRRFRATKTAQALQCNGSVTKCNIEIEKDIDIKIDIDKEKEKEKETAKRFVRPTVEQIAAYCKERNNNINAQRFYDFYESKGWKVGNQSMKDWKACVRTWEQRDNNDGKPAVIDEKPAAIGGKPVVIGSKSAERHEYTDDDYKSMFTELKDE